MRGLVWAAPLAIGAAIVGMWGSFPTIHARHLT
jgi:hypothetical protein